MQHLENDMDELFQRAAENYPLKTGDGDWESVAKRIADEPDSPASVVTSKNNGSKKIIALFLLLFLGAVSWFIFQNYQPGIDAAPGKNVLGNNNKKAESKTSTKEKNKRNSVDENTIAGVDKKNKSTQFISDGRADKTTADAEAKKNNRLVSFNGKILKAEIGKSLVGETSNNESLIKLNNTLSIKENINQKNDDRDPVENQIEEEEILSKNKGKEDTLNAAANEDKAVMHNEKKTDKASQSFQKKKGIYIGVVAGPDFNKVHSGSFDRSGVNAGIVAGYRFNKKLSLESGISWDRKYYSSEGKNFRMDKVGATMPSGMVINNLESDNLFVEIPLKIKFDFFTKRNSNLFISGGVSAYIITREKNMYHVTYNGDTKNLLTVYEKNNYGLPAVANLSAGYEKNIFKNFDIRIEPYLKIPLRGMGVGSLPVTSAGLQIGIISRLK